MQIYCAICHSEMQLFLFIYILPLIISQAINGFPSFWNVDCTESQLEQVNLNWSNRYFIATIREYMNKHGGNRYKYAPIFKGTCCMKGW